MLKMIYTFDLIKIWFFYGEPLYNIVNMKTKKIWPLVVAIFCLAAIAIPAGIITAKGKDLSIVCGLSSVIAVICLIILIVFSSQNRNTKKNYKNVRFSKVKGNSSYNGKGKEFYVPNIVLEFDEKVRLFFLELPFEEYKVPAVLYNELKYECQKGRPSTHLLQKILIDMEHHLKLKLKDVSIITMEKMDDNRAGYIEKNYYSFSDITVGYKDIYNADSYLAILAHELSHSYQFSLEKQNIFDKDKQELFTDALTFYLGFGRLTEKGKKVSRSKIVGVTERSTKYRVETNVLGYLDSKYFSYLYLMVEELRDQKKAEKEEKELNIQVINKISNLLDAITIHVSTIQSYIEEIKDKKVSKEDFRLIQEIILKYDSTYIEQLNAQIKGYKNSNLKDNQYKYTILEKEMEKVLKDANFLSHIIKN